MKKSEENIKSLLRIGAKLILSTEDFRYSELEDFVRLSANKETELTLIVGDSLNTDEVKKLVSVGKEFLRLDLSRD
jgi:c-di-AMP phosphodiesterase-like protein